ncbi:hypothetical protein IEO21_01276 [Rhodonia placenta]|uniref:Uncharacterized protein n=1 Tax=Rhodonia placenta TaxID=104341 RepID=A0A8H7PA21_9APHY|nr:hypothetical protein IEO21_01276 [Postia placenta]
MPRAMRPSKKPTVARRPNKRPTARSRTLAAVGRLESVTFTVEDVWEQGQPLSVICITAAPLVVVAGSSQRSDMIPFMRATVQADARATKQPFGQRQKRMLAGELQVLTRQTFLRWLSKGTYRSTAWTRQQLRAIHKGIDGQQFSSVRDKYDAEGAEIKAVFGPTKREVLNDVRDDLFEAQGHLGSRVGSTSPVHIDDDAVGRLIAPDTSTSTAVSVAPHIDAAVQTHPLAGSSIPRSSRVHVDAAVQAQPQPGSSNTAHTPANYLFSPVRAQHPAAAEAYPSPVSNFRHPIGRIPSGRAEPPSPTSPTPNASFRASARRSIPLGAEGKVDDDAARSDSGSSSSTAASPTGTPRIAALPLSSDAQQAADAASTAAAVSGGGTAQAARTPGQYRSLKGKLRETRRVLQDVLREHEKMRRQLRRRRRESLQADEELRLRKLRIQELDARVEKDVRVITFYERERTEVAARMLQQPPC